MWLKGKLNLFIPSSFKGLGWIGEALGWIALVWVHTFRIRTVPGLHFDEAWALNHAYRWVEGAGTLAGMSPYTSAWAQIFGALWMKLVGEGLLSFRLSQLFLSLFGLWFVSRALRLRFGESAATLFPWVVLLVPGIALNHRFAIELHSIHIFCFGLALFGLVKKQLLPLGVAFFFGVSSHLLFLAFPLALFVSYFVSRERMEPQLRPLITVLTVTLFAFSIQIFVQVPEKGKAALLILLCFGLLFLTWNSFFWSWLNSYSRFLKVFLLLAALPFLFNGFFFSSGLWSLATQKGWPLFSSHYSLWLIAYLPFLIPLVRAYFALSSREQLFFLALFALLGALMLKPAPRYFAFGMVAMASLIAVGLVLLWKERHHWRDRFVLGLMIAFASSHSYAVYEPYLNRNVRDVAVRFLWFKDESRDFLSKQKVVDFLSGSQCTPSVITEVDSRIGEAILALRRADWPIPEKDRCPFPSLRLLRASEGQGVPVPGSGLKLWAAKLPASPPEMEKGIVP